MRVTDEMVEVAARAMAETIAKRHGHDAELWLSDSRREDARAALEAALAVEGTEAQAKPVAWRYKYTDPGSGMPVWRDRGGLWNGQMPEESQPLYTTPPAGIREALEAAGDAMDEYYRYWTGGESRGSYDGKPERQRLWAAMHTVKAARAALRGQS